MLKCAFELAIDLYSQVDNNFQVDFSGILL